MFLKWYFKKILSTILLQRRNKYAVISQRDSNKPGRAQCKYYWFSTVTIALQGVTKPPCANFRTEKEAIKQRFNSYYSKCGPPTNQQSTLS